MGEVDSDTEMTKKDDDDIDNLKNLDDNDAGMSKATPQSPTKVVNKAQSVKPATTSQDVPDIDDDKDVKDIDNEEEKKGQVADTQKQDDN